MEYTSLSVRVWRDWLDILKKAVKAHNAKRREKGEPPFTLPDYVREVLGPIAAKEAGIPWREFPPFSRGRPSVQRQAADKLGVPLEKWRREILDTVANKIAEETLKNYGSGVPPSAHQKRKNA